MLAGWHGTRLHQSYNFFIPVIMIISVYYLTLFVIYDNIFPFVIRNSISKIETRYLKNKEWKFVNPINDPFY